MSMASYEPDRDWGDESAWEDVYVRATSGLCALCEMDAARPNDVICQSCHEEVVGDAILAALLEDEAA